MSSWLVMVSFIFFLLSPQESRGRNLGALELLQTLTTLENVSIMCIINIMGFYLRS